jgi:hypothetical protein
MGGVGHKYHNIHFTRSSFIYRTFISFQFSSVFIDDILKKIKQSANSHHFVKDQASE